MNYDYWNNQLRILGGWIVSLFMTYAAIVNKADISGTGQLIVVALFGFGAILGTLHFGLEIYKFLS